MGAEGKPIFNDKRKNRESDKQFNEKLKAARQKNMKDLREFNKMADEAGLSYGQMAAKLMLEKKKDEVESPSQTFVGEVTTIKDICQKHQVSQADICNMYGIPTNTMYSWYSGRYKPSDYIVRLLDDALEKQKSS